MALVTGLLVSGGAWAAGSEVPSTTQDYLAACEKGNSWFLYCAGLERGVANMLSSEFLIRPKFRVCIPKNVTAGQRIQVFINWAKANPKMWHEPGWSSMVVAFFEAWPCPK